MGQADLRATPLPDQPAPAIRLSARAHSACVSAPVAGFVPGGSYTVDLDYRTLQGLPARVCVWQDGPDRCAPMPKMEASGDWYHLHVAVTPEPGTAALRLFVYADAGAVGGDGTVVEYRALRVTSAAPLAVTMFDGDAGAPAPAVTWSALGGSAYQVEVAGSSRSFVLSLGESFASGWQLDGVPNGRRVEHVVADGYANGWLIEPGAAFTARISFAPDRTMRATILAYENKGTGPALYYYVVPTSGVLGPPQWTVTKAPANVAFTMEQGVLRMKLTGPNAEEITYSGTMQ